MEWLALGSGTPEGDLYSVLMAWVCSEGELKECLNYLAGDWAWLASDHTQLSLAFFFYFFILSSSRRKNHFQELSTSTDGKTDNPSLEPQVVGS